MTGRPAAWAFRHPAPVASRRRPRVAGQHQEPARAVQVEKGVVHVSESISLISLGQDRALVANFTATSWGESSEWR